jgi:hypothetical protein
MIAIIFGVSFRMIGASRIDDSDDNVREGEAGGEATTMPHRGMRRRHPPRRPSRERIVVSVARVLVLLGLAVPPLPSPSSAIASTLIATPTLDGRADRDDSRRRRRRDHRDRNMTSSSSSRRRRTTTNDDEAVPVVWSSRIINGVEVRRLLHGIVCPLFCLHESLSMLGGRARFILVVNLPPFPSSLLLTPSHTAAVWILFARPRREGDR